MLMGQFGIDADDGIVFFDDGIQLRAGRLTPFGIKEGFGKALRNVVFDSTELFVERDSGGRGVRAVLG
jgi:hypothetical protein